MIVLQVSVTAGDDYPRRREPHRRAHLDRAVALRQEGLLIGGGPHPDGRGAELFVRVERGEQLASLVVGGVGVQPRSWEAHWFALGARLAGTSARLGSPPHGEDTRP